MMKKIWIFVGLVIFGTLLMTGCRSAQSQPVEIPADNFNFLIGVWEIRVNGTPYQMEIAKDSTVTVKGNGLYKIASGPVRLEGNQLVDNSSVACEARYNVTIRQEPDAEMAGLHFELVGEDCYADRVESLDGKTLYPFTTFREQPENVDEG